MPRLVQEMEMGHPDWYGFAFLEESRTLSATIHQTESAQDHVDRGLVLRLMAGGRNLETASNDLDPDPLLEAARALRLRAEALPALPVAPVAAFPWSHWKASELEEMVAKQWPENPTPQTEAHFSPEVDEEPPATLESLLADGRARREKALAWDQGFIASNGFTEPLSSVMVQLRSRTVIQVFVDRERNQSQTLPITLSTLRGQTRGGRSMRALSGGMGGRRIGAFSEEDFALALGVPHRLDRAERLTPGSWPVLTGADVTGVIAHEAFGHTQEGDTVRQGRSISPQLRGRQIGNTHASILSHGALFQSGEHAHGTNASAFFDHEGQFSRKHSLLHAGVLGDPMTDLLSSQHLGLPATGNGKRESWRRPTLVRQTNTYFTWGTESVEDLIRKVRGTGFLARWSHGGMEDPKGANLTAGAEYLEEIVDGRLTGRLFVGPQGGHVELSGYVPEMLQGILGKSGPGPESAPDPLNLSGGCGKYHKEYVQAGCGGPWILWEKLLCG